MIHLRSKIIYFLVPLALVVGAIALVGSSNSSDTAHLKRLGTHATTISLDPPDDLNFAGEIVPLHDFDVQERLDNQLIRYIYYHSASIMNIKRAARWRPEMTRILRANKVPEDFFYLCVAESHLTNATSPVGAKGFWQFMKATAELYGLEVSNQVDERYDPIKSTHAACRYLKDSYQKFGNWTLVAASYNMGMAGLQRQIDRQQVDNYYDLYLNQETAAYVFRILALKTVLENPGAYGFEITDEQLYQPLRYKTVKVTETQEDMIEFARKNGTTYKMLRVMNPWLLGDRLEVSGGKVYELKIPRNADNLDHASELIPDTGTTVMDSTVSDSTRQVLADSLELPVTDTIPVLVPADSLKNKNKGN